MRAFDTAFTYLLGNEGFTFSDHDQDSGGPTKMGITQKAYSLYVGRQVSEDEIKSLTIENAQLFYEESIWVPLRCHKMDYVNEAVAIFDSGTLFGLVTVGRIVQRTLIENAINVGPIDGVIGPETLKGLNGLTPKIFLPDYCRNLMRRINTIIEVYPKNEVFRNGWERRVDRIEEVLTGNSQKYVII